jgi:hypothetical protein
VKARVRVRVRVRVKVRVIGYRLGLDVKTDMNTNNVNDAWKRHHAWAKE